MKSALVFALIVAIALVKPDKARSPKDAAARGTNAAMKATKVTVIKMIPPPLPDMTPQAVTIITVTNEVTGTNPPGTNPPPPRHTALPFTWTATNGIGFTTYVFLATTNLTQWFLADDLIDEHGATNSIYAPDGMVHTSYIQLKLTVPGKFYRLTRF